MEYADFVPRQRFRPTLAVSPDGTEVAYASNRGGQYDLWIASLDGDDHRRLTEFTGQAVRAIAWSPDGSRLAFAADDEGDEQYQLHLIDADGADLTRLTGTDDRQHELGVAPFSPDGRVLAYGANDRDPMVQDLVLHDLSDGTTRRVESQPGVMLQPLAFSPDGRRLLVVAARSNTDLDAALVDLDADELTLDIVTGHDGEQLNVAEAWLASGEEFLLGTDRDGEFRSLAVARIDSHEVAPYGPAAGTTWDVESASVSQDGGTVVWTLNEGGASSLHRAVGDASAEGFEIGGVADPVALVPGADQVVMLLSTATRPTELAVLDLDGGAVRYLTDSRPPALRSVSPIDAELVHYESHDGRSIPGWLHRPLGDGPFPVVVSVHGGPEAQERPSYNYAGLYQYLLARGIGVFAPNVRGSTGYGKSYQQLIHRDWGGAELLDLEAANRYLRGLDWVDGERLGVFGGSFGGFASLSCLSRQPDLWAAGVSVVGPSNLQTLVRSAPPTWRPLIAAWIGDPDDDADFLAERSPLTYADQIVAPLLVVQGANDPRVAKAESDQIVDSLRARGVDVAYEVYPDEGHGFTKRENEIDAMGKVAYFLVSHLT